TASGSSDLWLMKPDGTEARQLTIGARVYGGGISVSPDNRYAMFVSNRSGGFNIWRVDIDDGSLKQLNHGVDENSPQYSPDGRWLVYELYDSVTRSIWKVPIGGGESVRLTENHSMRPDISPDGKLIAYFHLDKQRSGWEIGVVSIEGGALLRRFPL